jgi:hypothetical protein
VTAPKSSKEPMGKETNHTCTGLCFVTCGSFGAMAGCVLFILFGVFALVVPAGPFNDREKTLGIVLVVLGATGVSTLGGYLACAVPGATVGYMIDKSVDCCTSV